MEFPLRAATTGFATADISQGEGATEKTRLVNDLRQARAAVPFAIGELRAVHGGLPFLKYYSI